MAVQRPFEEIVAAHGSVVMRVCRALLGPTDAEDAWAETFLSALRSYPDLRPDSNVRGWLVTIAHRKAIDQIRANTGAPRPTDRLPEAVATEGIPGGVPDTELWAALAALPPKQRATVVYHHVAGLPYAEVGALLETSEAAARRSAADGIARLRQHYQEETPR
jgi:RNA polymerase sigma factor (sigma-70 family)